jgi:F-type H+-transporting ATPase subunit a
LEIHVPIQPAVVFTIFGLPVTNSLLTSWIVILLLIVFSLLVTRRMELVPRGIQNVGEGIIEILLKLAEQVAGSHARAFLPLVATLFLFILTANWFSVLPGVGTLALDGNAILRNPNSDLSITAAMAAIVFVWVQVVGLRASIKQYFLKFVFPIPILEILTEISRPLSLALRLYGNLLAGFILVEVMLQIAPILVPALFMGLEIGVGLIQALIFSILTLAFLSLAGSHGHSEGHAEAEHSAH